MEVHAHILPIDLLFHKVLFRATARICTLPTSHPLQAIANRASRRCIKRHKSPLHHLFSITGLRPSDIETISPTRREHEYITPHSTHIEPTKEDALHAANRINASAPVRVYVDGSGYKGGIGAAAILYEGTRVIAVRRYHLGKATKYTVHNGEAVGIIMGIHTSPYRLHEAAQRSSNSGLR